MTTSTLIENEQSEMSFLTFKEINPNLFNLIFLMIVYEGKSETNSLIGGFFYKIAIKMKRHILKEYHIVKPNKDF